MTATQEQQTGAHLYLDKHKSGYLFHGPSSGMSYEFQNNLDIAPIQPIRRLLIYQRWGLLSTLQWRHDERDSVSNHRRLNCFLNHLFRRWSKKTLMLCVTELCELTCDQWIPRTNGLWCRKYSNLTSSWISTERAGYWLIFKITHFKFQKHFSWVNEL